MAHLLRVLIDQLLEHLAFGTKIDLLHVSSDTVFYFFGVLTKAERGLCLL